MKLSTLSTELLNRSFGIFKRSKTPKKEKTETAIKDGCSQANPNISKFV